MEHALQVLQHLGDAYIGYLYFQEAADCILRITGCVCICLIGGYALSIFKKL